MKLQKSLLAAAIAALPLLAAQSAFAAAPLMGGPVAQSASENASLISTLMSQRGRSALSSHHGFAMASKHPGENGTAAAPSSVPRATVPSTSGLEARSSA